VLAACLLALTGMGCAASQGPDPWEPVNRKTFAFNETVDRYALAPMAHAWDFVMPSPVEQAFRRAFVNMTMPRVFLNDVLQGYPVRAGQDVVRFVLNSTFGYAGLFDVATDAGIPDSDADFGETLGVWGLGSGPYVVLPFLGPSDVRDTVGWAADWASTPWSWFLPYWGSGIFAVRVINLRAIYNGEIEENRRSALDYYVFLRNAYLQNRESRIQARRHGGQQAPPEDIYDVDEGNDVEP
jgi:phospholipid-binding lipoprotein MlaA